MKLQLPGVRHRFRCPKCQGHFLSHALVDCKGATMNCPHCDALLMCRHDTGALQPFHEWMHEQDPRWPRDGADTSYIEVRP